MKRWRQIKHAPKDGTHLLLCSSSGPGVAIGSWDDRNKWHDTEGRWIDPTHFITLPSPPKARGK